MLVATGQLSFDTTGTPKVQAFVNISARTVYKSKTEYWKELLNVYDAISKIYAEESDKDTVSSFTYEG